MTRTAINMTTVAMLSMALVTAQWSTALAAGSDTPSSPPASDGKAKDKKKGAESRPRLEDTAFLARYRAAYATVYDRNDYTSAIEQLKALGQDDRADVANLIGYSYRKLGDYKLAQAYYERALKADPGHVRTWQYYGLWQIEQGNRDQAQYHLGKIGALAGTESAEYKSLASALAGSATVY
jgi:tetratricopeptide (TPR) repeat protein